MASKPPSSPAPSAPLPSHHSPTATPPPPQMDPDDANGCNAVTTRSNKATTPPPPPPSAPSPPPPTSPLLRLPPELRTLIYAHLTPPTPLSYPLGPATAISALSHRPPPLALLLSSRALAAEALDHFYRTATFRVRLNPPAPLADPHFQRLAALPLLRRVRRLGVVLDWECPRALGAPAALGWDGGGLGLEAGADGGDEVFFRSVMERGKGADMLRLAKRLAGVLGAAGELRVVVVGWTDLVDGGWEGKRAVLEVLRKGLGERGVRVVRGEVVAANERRVGELFEGWKVEGSEVWG